jgi:hypothetical protein
MWLQALKAHTNNTHTRTHTKITKGNNVKMSVRMQTTTPQMSFFNMFSLAPPFRLFFSPGLTLSAVFAHLSELLFDRCSLLSDRFTKIVSLKPFVSLLISGRRPSNAAHANTDKAACTCVRVDQMDNVLSFKA